jgi:hypothetical protein
VALSTSNQAYLPATIKPNPVVLGITGVTDSSVNLTWSTYSGNNFKNYKVYYSLNDNVKTTDSLVDSIMFNTDTFKIVQRLLPATRYYFRVITTTQSGIILASNIQDTMTFSQVIKKSIMMLDPDSITQTSVRLHWSKSDLAFDRYRIFADTIPNVDHFDVLVKTPLITDTMAIITGLKANQNYWFRIYAQKGPNDIAFSDSTKITTLMPINLPNPVSLQITRADSAITLQWTQYSGNDFKNYKVYLSHNVSVETTDSLKDSLTIQSDTTILVKPIVAGTLYSFRVFVTNQQNASTPSNIADTTILQTPLANLVLSDPPDTVDSSFVVLHWAPYTPTPDQYIIYADTAISEKFTDATSRYFGIDTNVKIKGLMSNHYYAFRVYALKNQARVAASNIVAVRTK